MKRPAAWVFATRWRPALVASGLAFIVFSAASANMLVRQSQAPQFIYQADAWVHGRLHLAGEPPNRNDWVLHKGKWFQSFPPFPALLMTPFVALHGLRFNDVFFIVCLSALNVGLFFSVLRAFRDDARGHPPGADDGPWLTDPSLLALSLFWAFGSVYFYSSIRGEVWFSAHVVGVGLTCLYLLAARGARYPLLAGLALGFAATTRANLAFAFVFILVEVLAPEGRLPSLRQLPVRAWRGMPTLLKFGIPMAAVLGVSLWMNHARFGDALEFGHRLMWNNRVNARIAETGLFDLSYLPGNLKSALLLLPTIQTSPLRIGFDGNGMSMLLTTPLLILIPFVLRRRARPMLALGLTALAVALPGLLYMNNGWFQFGFRFSNDYLPYLFLLLALGLPRLARTTWGLGILGVAVSTWGAIVFNRP